MRSCEAAFYCSREHQVQDWKTHKTECRSRTQQTKGKSSGGRGSADNKTRASPGANDWPAGLSKSERYEWLCDAYRLRLDDDYVYGGCYLHGCYDPDATKSSIVADFLLFCKLAAKAKVFPADWDWSACLSTAKNLIMYAFEKSDAIEKWGSKQPLCTIMLRLLAESVCGSLYHQSDDDVANRNSLSDRIRGSYGSPIAFKDASLFEDVGGVQVWQTLYRQMILAND